MARIDSSSRIYLCLLSYLFRTGRLSHYTVCSEIVCKSDNVKVRTTCSSKLNIFISQITIFTTFQTFAAFWNRIIYENQAGKSACLFHPSFPFNCIPIINEAVETTRTAWVLTHNTHFWKRCYSITLIFKSAVIGIYALENRLRKKIILIIGERTLSLSKCRTAQPPFYVPMMS